MKFDVLVENLLNENDTSYRGEHTAPDNESGAPAYDLTLNGIYPKDVYNMPSWYETDDGLLEMRKILRLKGNPESYVWVYRSIPKKIYNLLRIKSEKENISFLRLVFNDGDWVTTNKKYAEDHGAGALLGDHQVVGLRTKAKNIFTNGDSIFEWGFYRS
ncbi:MAG: hypothetical protein EBQ92_02475 [Proteobacteria bacterium]|nr:hypothetical protein [Pseudomonadota bacterium]